MRRLEMAAMVLVLASGAVSIPAAHADGTKATANFERGMRLYQVGEYAKALEEFKAGYLEEADPAFLYNTAQCYWRLGQEGEALLAFQRFLVMAPETPLRPHVEKKIAELERSLEAARSSSAGTAPLPVPGGAPAPGSAGPGGLVATPSSVEAEDSAARWPVWVTGAMTLAFAGGATFLGLHTNQKFDSYRNSCGNTPAGCSSGQIDFIKTRARVVNVLWALTGASAIATGITVYATSGGSGVSLAFRY